MRLHTHDPFGLLPNYLMQMRSALTGYPHLLNCTGDFSVGNASGISSEGVLAAYGEYLERYHFYNEVLVSEKQKITDPVMLAAVQQIQQCQTDASQHHFEMCAVTELNTPEHAFIPKSLLSLTQSNSDDAQFIPYIDSCGQSAHISADLSLQAALQEFVERQALVSAWLSGKALFKIKNLNNTQIPLLDLFNAHGELHVFQLGENLPGFSVIIFYFAKSNRDKVQYAVGMANDYAAASAIQKASNELWQTYQFMYLNADTPENLDSRFTYLNNLLSFNNADTYSLIPFKEAHVDVIYNDFVRHAASGFEKYKQSIKVISERVYVYQSTVYLFGKKFYVCKITSPDFYLHMGLQKPLNYKNKYSEILNISSAFANTSIPFP